MRRGINILLLLVSFGFAHGQGYGRNVGKDFSRRIIGLHPLENGTFRLHLQNIWNGSGPDNGTDFFCIYNPEKDSLGQEQITTTWHSAGYIYNRASLQLSKTQFLFSEQECCAGGDPQGLSIRNVDLKRAYAVPLYQMPYQTGAFDPLYVKDTIYILRSLDSIQELRKRSFGNNTRKILAYYDLAKDSLLNLDTINFGIDFKTPGSLLYDSINQEFELLYDTLQFFFRRGDTLPARTKVHRGSFWKGGRARSISQLGKIDLYYSNQQRNYYLKNDSSWEVLDTLGYDWIQLYQDRFGVQKVTFPEIPPEVPFEGYGINTWGKSIGNSTIYLASHEGNQSIYLLEYQDDTLISALYLKERPHGMWVYDLYKNADGSYYLVGEVPRYEPHSTYYTWSIPIFVKVDPQGNYQKNEEVKEIFLHLTDFGKLFLFLEEPYLDYNYRIIDLKGRLRKEGSTEGSQSIRLSNLQSGAYLIQLWYANNGKYLGEGKFIKP